jgi:hypothetical protein
MSSAAELTRSVRTPLALRRDEVLAARSDNAPHLAGRKVSASTYNNAGCRCPGCSRAASIANASYRRRSGRTKRHRFHPTILRLRQLESRRRYTMAKWRAKKEAGERWRDAYPLERARVNAEAGPLPGDDA